MKVLVTGSGGREHALAWKLAQSPNVEVVFVAPGNGGCREPLRRVPIPALDVPGIRDFALREGIGLVVIGPDDALALGCADALRDAGIPCVGPGAAAARLESSKAFAKQFMQRYGIPCAKSEIFSEPQAALEFCARADYPLVIKADGLALGKGVLITHTHEEAAAAIRRIMVERVFGSAGERVVIEEFLTGTECSLHLLISDGQFTLFPEAKDHKRAGEGDTGLNTGGMGTISPTGLLTPELQQQILECIVHPFLRGLAAEGLDYRGVLFPGLMLTAQGPKVLEFNCRFGDPETQVFLRRLECDLAELLLAVAEGRLTDAQPKWNADSAVCVVVASGGYPGDYRKGLPISGIEKAESVSGVVVFHAGTTADENGQLVTAGGRVLNVTAIGETLDQARQRAYAAAKKIQFEGAFFRRDIGGEIIE